ncbi:MAG: tetratricopeptide repeat protein, partial [Polyangiales bacterium]
ALGGAALGQLARIHRQRGEHRSALEYLHRAHLLLRNADDSGGIASIQDDMAELHRALGELEPALAAAESALAAREALGEPLKAAHSRTTLGFIELDRGDLAAAQAHFEVVEQLRGQAVDPEGVLRTEVGLGKLAFLRGALELACEHYTRALELASQMSHRRWQCVTLTELAEVRLASGRAERAHGLLLRAHALAVELRDSEALTEIRRALALVALDRGEPAAEQQLMAALELAREQGTRRAIALAQRGLARMRARTLYDDQRTSPAGDAELAFRESIRIFEESGNLREAACTRAELGFHLAERGAEALARTTLGEAYAALEPMRLPELVRVTETLAQLNG